jgi:hypothetical protein
MHICTPYQVENAFNKPPLVQVKSSEEAVILCKTTIGSLKLEINDLPATKVKHRSKLSFRRFHYVTNAFFLLMKSLFQNTNEKAKV